MKRAFFAMLAALAVAGHANADIIISEVSAWGSGNAPYAADWFELTNRGASAVDITGWTFDDDSNVFNPSNGVLTGVSSIAAGQSVVFIQGDSTTVAAFNDSWFGANVPSGFTIGTYTGNGIGLSTNGDGVNIFNSAGVRQAQVNFEASTLLFTFDNAAGNNGPPPVPPETSSPGTILTLSAIGTNGAFLSVTGNQIGSPGTAVPEPTSMALLGTVACLGAFGARFRKRFAK